MNTLKKHVLINFVRQLNLVLESDMSIQAGIEVIMNKTSHESLKDLLSQVLIDLKDGYSLGEAVVKFEVQLTPFVVQMIQLGEKSGNLSVVVKQIADTLEKELLVKEKVKSALTYPLILSLLMFGVVVLLIVKVLPTFQEILESLGGQMPGFTKGMMNVSNWLLQYGIFMILAVVVLIGMTWLLKLNEKTALWLDRMKFKLPIQKHILGALSGAKFTGYMSMLLKSGFNFGIAFEMIQPTFKNKYMKQLLIIGQQKVSEGTSLADVMMDFHVFPSIFLDLFAVSQQTGHMDRMLDQVSLEMSREADKRLERLSTVLEPIIITVLSVLVGVILLSILLPILSILNAIG